MHGDKRGRKMSLDVGSHRLAAWRGVGPSQGGLMDWQYCGKKGHWVGGTLKPGMGMTMPYQISPHNWEGDVPLTFPSLFSLHTCLKEVMVQDKLWCPAFLYLEETAMLICPML